MDLSKLEGLQIDEAVATGNGMQLTLEDGTILVGNIFVVAAPAKPAEKKPEPPAPKPEEKKPAAKTDPEVPTWDEIQEMDMEELKEVIDDHDLDIKTKGREEDDVREDIIEELEIEEPKKEKKGAEKKPVKKDADDLEWEDLMGMDKEELADLVKEEKLKVNPDDYDDDEVEDFRKAIAKKLDIDIPKKK